MDNAVVEAATYTLSGGLGALLTGLGVWFQQRRHSRNVLVNSDDDLGKSHQNGLPTAKFDIKLLYERVGNIQDEVDEIKLTTKELTTGHARMISDLSYIRGKLSSPLPAKR